MIRPLVPLVVAALLVAGCGSALAPHASTAAAQHAAASTRGSDSTSSGSRSTSTASNPAGTRAKASTHRRHHRSAKASACPSLRLAQLPQTSSQPSAATAAFRCEMAALWAGVRTGTLAPALPAFFPEAAYAQLKGIANPQGDWGNRLVADYTLDLQAAHALLGAHAAQARLVKVVVPPSFAHVIPPGVCYNRYSYWETPNSRVVYREDGALHSFGIASMISWRGNWYVVHLGAILRSGAGGEVDAPSAGVGVAVPSSTC